jgi:hypothetical protein
MNMRMVWVLVFTSALSLSPAQTPIWGQVFETNSQEPIVGAVLRIGGQSRLVYSNHGGYFSTQVSAQGRITLYLQALGYRSDMSIPEIG